MAKVIIYTVDYCPYCKRAKALLDSKNVQYTEFDITDDEINGRKKLAELTGGRNTLPQIFINDKHIGGSDDLMEIDTTGELDKLLQESA